MREEKREGEETGWGCSGVKEKEGKISGEETGTGTGAFLGSVSSAKSVEGEKSLLLLYSRCCHKRDSPRSPCPLLFNFKRVNMCVVAC